MLRRVLLALPSETMAMLMGSVSVVGKSAVVAALLEVPTNLCTASRRRTINNNDREITSTSTAHQRRLWSGNASIRDNLDNNEVEEGGRLTTVCVRRTRIGNFHSTGHLDDSGHSTKGLSYSERMHRWPVDYEQNLESTGCCLSVARWTAIQGIFEHDETTLLPLLLRILFRQPATMIRVVSQCGPSRSSKPFHSVSKRTLIIRLSWFSQGTHFS